MLATSRPRYLLDTNAASDIGRGLRGDTRHARIVAKYLAAARTRILFCPIVIGELRAGAEGAPNPRDFHRETDRFVSAHGWAPRDLETTAHYGRLRFALRTQPIGYNDAWIAAHGLRHGLIVVTHNTREFGRVPGLQIDDWT